MKPQLDYVQYSIDVLSQKDVDSNTKEYAISTLKKRVKELAPLFTECAEKGIDMQQLCPELNLEWNTIVMLTRNI
jgi:hypothetical protein